MAVVLLSTLRDQQMLELTLFWKTRSPIKTQVLLQLDGVGSST